MNIFTRKKTLLAANRELALWLKYERETVRYLIRIKGDLDDKIKKLQNGVKEPLRIILVDERKE